MTTPSSAAARHSLEDDIYSSTDLSVTLPKSHFPSQEHNPRAVFAAIRDELMLDGNSRQNLATFCQTWVEEEVHTLMDLCIDKNIEDKDEYPQTAEIEARCARMVADLWHAPAIDGAIGCSTTGSSEAAMLGGLAMKRRWEARRQGQGQPSDRPNLVTGPVQICWHKFCRYWDIEHREIPMEPDRLILSPEAALRHCDANTIGVMPTLGVTFTGQYEPVQQLAAALDDLQARTGLDIPIHVDAASGGFLAPLGVGWVLWRQTADLPEEMVFWVNYLGGNMRDLTLNFSRPGGKVVCQCYNFLRLGREIGAMGPFEILFDGDDRTGIPALTWKIREGSNVSFNLYGLADRLRVRGWQVPAYSLPAH